MNSDARPTIVIAGGGTGGHIFPGLAIAEALRELADVRVVFAGTPKGLEARVVPERGYEIVLLDVAPMKGGGVGRAVRGALIAGGATIRALGVVRRLAPRAIVSVGGYAAGPISLAAAATGVPLAIVEPNSVTGFSNRILAPLARRAYVAWEETVPRVGQRKARVFGVPLRAGFTPRPYEARETMRVLVLGGSLGALALNERVPEAVADVGKAFPLLEVVHQAGEGHARQVSEAYARIGFTRSQVVPFIADVPAEMARADVIIARAGASTVAEISAIGRASLLIPFPHAADDHQAMNARALERMGGAVSIRQEAADAGRLAREFRRLLADGALRVRMANAARACGKPDAAERIARDLLELVEIPLVRRSAAIASQTNGYARAEAH